MYHKHVSEPWFSLIASGVKTCEGRLCKDDFRAIQVGDILVFHHANATCRTRVVCLTTYDTFEEYLQEEGLDACLPGVASIEEGVAVYHQYYSWEEECLYGVRGIQIERLDIGLDECWSTRNQ